MRGFRPVDVFLTIYACTQRSASRWQVLRCSHVAVPSAVPGRQAHAVLFLLRRLIEHSNGWQLPIYVMDCDVSAAFDHVSHRLIVDAMESMFCPC